MPKTIDQIMGAVTLGKGKLFFKEKGRTDWEDLLEVDDFKFTGAIERVEKNSSRDSTVTQIADIAKSSKVTGSFACITALLQVIRFFHMADAVEDVSQAAGSLDFSGTFYKGKWKDLGKVKLSNVLVYKTIGKDFTAEPTTEVCSSTAHGFLDGDRVVLTNSGGALPAGLAAETAYYVRDKTTDSFKLAATVGGAAIDITDAGTGTQTAHFLYSADADYELDEKIGYLHTLEEGDIADASGLIVIGDYAAQAMYSLQGMTKLSIEGEIAFHGDNNAEGVTGDFFSHVKLFGNGDFSMIGEDLQKFEIQYTCLKSSARRGLFEFRDRSGKSKAVAAV